MSLDEKVIKYGIVGGVRYKEPEKVNFLNNISQEFIDLGYDVKVLKKDLKRFSGTNAYIGDVVNADHLIIANYDTPMDSMDKKMKYFPFDYRATEKELTEKMKFYAAYVILTGAVIMFLPAIFFNLNPTFQKWFWLIGTVVATIIAYLCLRGVPNKVNANLNTSGVLGVLEIAKQKPKNTAFILTDRAYVDNLGDAMVKEALPTSLEKKKVIYLSAIGRGENIVISFKEHNKMMAQKLGRSTKEKNVQLFELNEVGLYRNPLEYYNQAVTVTVADKFNDIYEISDVCSENDIKIEEDNFNKVIEMIINYLK